MIPIPTPTPTPTPAGGTVPKEYDSLDVVFPLASVSLLPLILTHPAIETASATSNTNFVTFIFISIFKKTDISTYTVLGTPCLPEWES